MGPTSNIHQEIRILWPFGDGLGSLSWLGFLSLLVTLFFYFKKNSKNVSADHIVSQNDVSLYSYPCYLAYAQCHNQEKHTGPIVSIALSSWD
jgi:hypothetical protein